MTDRIRVDGEFRVFDPTGYEAENYGELDPIDVEFRPFMADAIGRVASKAGIERESLDFTIEAFTGPWPIGTTLLAPYVAPNAICLATDVSPNNIAKLSRAFEEGNEGNLGVWEAQRPSFDACGPEWVGSLEKVRKLGVAQSLNIDYCSTLEGEADAVSAICGSESSTDDYEKFVKRTRQLVRLVKPGGLVAIGYSEKSTGYFAGVDAFGIPIWCPAVSVSQGDFQAAIGDMLDHEHYFFIPDQKSKRNGLQSDGPKPPGKGPHTWQGLGGLVAQRRCA